MKIRLLYFTATALLLLSSCKPKQNISYMENIESVALQASKDNPGFTIQPGDQLMINISAKDMDVVKPFNQNYSSGEITQFSTPNSNMPIPTRSTGSNPTYVVDSQGNFDFPILGTFNTSGKTIEMLQDEFKSRLVRYVKDPGVNIRNTNFKVTVLGEVNAPGQYWMPDGQPATILSVLGMAGDLTIYGKRDNILMVRNVNGTTEKAYINIADANFINSPYYYVKQNDVIYIMPNEAKKNSSSFGPQTAVWISVASIVVGLIAIFIKK